MLKNPTQQIRIDLKKNHNNAPVWLRGLLCLQDTLTNWHPLMTVYKSLSALIIAVAWGLMAQSGYAQQTHYVDARMGNDSFDGSTFKLISGLQGPFFTIKRAISKAKTGDIIAVRAGDYTREGVINVGDKQLTLLLFPMETSQTVLLDGMVMVNETGWLTLANSEEAANGVFLTNGDENDLALHSGTIHISGQLAIAKGGKLTRTEGTLTGSAPVMLEK